MPVIQCRRACMSCFHEIWKQLHRSRDRHLGLNGKAKDELLLAIALAPLMVTKLEYSVAARAWPVSTRYGSSCTVREIDT